VGTGSLSRRGNMGGVNIDLLFRIAGIGIFISVLNIVLKQAEKQEQAQMLTLVGVVIVLLMVLQLINELFQTMKTIFNLF
jgi:stage III sporulation protein AC